MPVNRPPPSPVLPLLVLGILGFLLMASTYWRFASLDAMTTRPGRSTTMNASPGSIIVLIVLGAIFVQAFGMPHPHRQDADSPLLTLLESLLHNSTFPMFITIVLILILLAGLTVGFSRHAAPLRPSPAARCYLYKNRWYC